MNEVIKPWRRVGDFHGRATRKEYWSAMIQLTLIFVLFVVFFVAADETLPSPVVMFVMGMLMLVFLVVAAVVGTSVGIRRIHDFDVTGWLVLTFYIPYLGWIAMIIIGCIPGTPSQNRWGADPRGGPALQQVFS
ncbi:MAG: DUF805 domain-containing protein [Allosphingosinicella sp.]|uniref:DUF805 domain-containing protein n=1 Tax=Allosphingosinicella sp. TaxID=2823234 RepID=UPI0039312390